jgi:3-hydroxyisobutyrate dehydrogenase
VTTVNTENPATSSAKIAFLGLGRMGAPMAANLIKAGYSVAGYDPVPAAREAAQPAGIDVHESATSAVRDAEVVITMLPDGGPLLDCYRETLPAAPAGSLFLDCSTVAVADARAARDLAVAAGHRALDAPVSGGVGGAEAGTLTFMVGALEEDFADAYPVLDAMGGRIVHCGPSGAGQAAKICNNMILGVSMIAVSEAFVLGERLGLSHQALFDVASAASGQCWALTTNCPVPGPVPASPANRDYQPGFAASLMAKDLGLAARSAAETGVDAQLGLRAAQLYREFADAQQSPVDFSAIVKEIREHRQ